MKAILNTLLLGCLLFSWSACDLREEIIDMPTPGNLKTEQDVNALIHGIYAVFNDGAAFKYQGMLMLFLAADDFYSNASGDFISYGEKTYNAVNTGFFWDALYRSIRDANYLIRTLDELELDPAFEKRAYGEACFIRAFAHFYLVRLYGGVPVRASAVDIGSDFYLPRNTVAEVYGQIFTDFKAASALLPPQSQIPGEETGRASKGAAQALLALASLTYGNHLALEGEDAEDPYRQALLYADSVIQSGEYRLLDDFGALFEVSRENDAYQEVIFGIRFSTDALKNGLASSGSEFAFRLTPGNFSQMSGNSPYGNGNGAIRVMPWYYDHYKQGDYAQDYRIERSFVERGYHTAQARYFVTYPNIPGAGEGTINSPFCGKYIDPDGKDQRNNENDFFVIRLAEVYLIKAEAENELNGPNEAAYAAFNMLRERARKAGGTPREFPANLQPGLSREEFRMKIFEERGAELFGEGHRWFDLVRMQHPSDPSRTMYEYQFLEVLPAHPQQMPAYRPAQAAWSNSGAVYAPALRVSEKHKLFPVPVSELSQNPNFGAQNPGW